MEFSAPIYRLKRMAKQLARQKSIPLHAALDQVAAGEGFARWSLLAAKAAARSPGRTIYAGLAPGALLLVGARPGHGKTLLSLELAIEAMRQGHRASFFTLEYTANDMLMSFRAVAAEPAMFDSRFDFDNSDSICADHIIAKLETAGHGSLAVIDYLQLLDQKRENADLASQLQALKRFARERGVTLVFISQIDRTYDPTIKPMPGIEDVRMPNPIDLQLFDQACFLQDGKISLKAA
jgi:replicative DNA helicase